MNDILSPVTKYSIYYAYLSLLFGPLKFKCFTNKLIKHDNIITSELWIVSNTFIFQKKKKKKMTPPKFLSSTEKGKAKLLKLSKQGNFPPEIQNPEHLTPMGKGMAKVNEYAEGPAESLQKVSQQIEDPLSLVKPKHLTPAEEGITKVVEYAEYPAENL